MKSLTSTNNHYSLHNVDNYNSVLDNSLNDILDKYIHLICEYLKFIVERMSCIRRKEINGDEKKLIIIQ